MSKNLSKSKHYNSKSKDATLETTNAIICHGCKKVFNQYKTEKSFISHHGSKRKECKDALIQCPYCTKLSYNEQSHNRHLFANKSTCLRKKKNESKQAKKFSSSVVKIVSTSNKEELKIPHKRENQLKYSYSDMNYDKNLVSLLAEKIKMYDTNETKVQKSHISSLSKDKTIVRNNNRETGTKASFTNKGTIEKNLLCVEINSDGTTVNHGMLYNNNRHCEMELAEDNEDLETNINEVIIDNEETNSLDDMSIRSNGEVQILGNATTINIDDDIFDIDDFDEDMIDRNDEDERHVNTNTPEPPSQDFLQILNKNHLQEMRMTHIKERAEVSSDVQYLDGLNLMKILMKQDQSLTRYNEYMKWKYGGRSKNKYLSKAALEKKALTRVYGETIGDIMKPKTTSLELPSGLKVNVTTLSFDGILYDLLSDYDLMQPHNLIFKDGSEENPFFVDSESTVFNDFDSSNYYIKTMNSNDAENDKVLTCPLMLYMDEATLDSYSKLSFHPVCISFMIFNRKTRNKERAWRTLGYMPNLSSLTGSKSLSPVMKLADFHYILRYIINGIAKVQKLGGLEWTFSFKDYPTKEYNRLVKFPLGVWIGDGKGNDTICGKYQNRTNTSHICRDCNIRLEDSDKPNANCTFHKMKDIRKMSRDELHAICFHEIKPTYAFDDIDFGANPYGINGCTPIDICHQFNKGFEELLPSILRKRLTAKMVKAFDIHCAVICSHMRRQSERDLPQLNPFTKGVTEASKLTSNENVARVFACFITLTSRDFESVVVGKNGRKPDKETKATPITQKEYNKWIMVFEEALIIYAWINLEDHPKVFFKGGKNSAVSERIRKFMDKFMGVAERKEGKGMKTMKWHQTSHYNWFFCLFAALLNVDAARLESYHKKRKQIAAKTQRQFDKFDEQTADKEFVYNVLLKAMIQCGIPMEDKFECNFDDMSIDDNEDEDEVEDNDNHVTFSKYGSHFTLIFDYDNEKVNGNWKSYKMKKDKFDFPKNILDSFYHKMAGYNHGNAGRRIKSIDCFTEYRTKAEEGSTTVYRCCSNYRKSGDWFDWATITWDEFGDLDAQLLLFFDVDSIEFEPTPNLLNNEAHERLSYSKGVMLHSISANSTAKQRQPAKSTPMNRRDLRSGPVTRICEFSEMENEYQIVDIQSITSPTFVIKDKVQEGTKIFTPGNATHVYTIFPRSEWSKYFIDYESESAKEEAATRRNNEIDEDDETYPFEG